MRFGVPRRADPVIDVTPMIDVVFQLLLFFMVTTTFISSPGIEVDLPKSSSDVVLGDDDDIDIWVTVEGAVYADDAPVSTEELVALFRRKAKADPNTMVVIKADEGVSHGRVVGVMDMARAEGLSRLAIATEAGDARKDEP
ncbi:MAG: biopolymer transporter ExbD [Alphaproteobacteria bacterium]|nr:biopolymer transporter ExbD [Myxococcales bacterium]MCB9670458.1 biopolymer transporter ExbD [Alphaproteobacteria bacterium]MCB9694268.1 biopolymer transporter ExbD [Alphaproteobacteria bacterium]